MGTLLSQTPRMSCPNWGYIEDDVSNLLDAPISQMALIGDGVMKKLQVLGTGCLKCAKLAETTEAAAQDLGIEYEIEKVKEIDKIMAFGAMMMPALAVDGEVKIAGKVPSIEEIKALIQ